MSLYAADCIQTIFVHIIGNMFGNKMCAKTCVIELQTYSLFFNKTIKLKTILMNYLEQS